MSLIYLLDSNIVSEPTKPSPSQLVFDRLEKCTSNKTPKVGQTTFGGFSYMHSTLIPYSSAQSFSMRQPRAFSQPGHITRTSHSARMVSDLLR